MQRGTSRILGALAIVVALTQCTGGQSGHEGGGLDGPADGPDGGQVGGSGGGGSGPNDGAGAGGDPGNQGAGAGGSDGCVRGGSGGTRATGDSALDHDGGVEGSGDAGTDECMPDDKRDEDGGTGSSPGGDPTPLDSEHVCEQSAVEAPIDCLDVCGALVTCDGAIECDSCLERCNESRQAPPSHGIRCLSLAIYWIDEEGCERMVQEYEAYTDAFDCGG
jgi:hypothetical protein